MKCNIDNSGYVHGRILEKKSDSQLTEVINAYEEYREKVDNVLYDSNKISELVTPLNDYRKIAIPVFDKMLNSGQSGLASTIMEEFLFILFSKLIKSRDITATNLYLGKGNSYVNMNFTPNSFKTIFENPHVNVHTKDQDFVLGSNIEIEIRSGGSIESKKTTIPILAIECKTYLERNMLDSCAATAHNLKKAMPYCVYIVVSEYMKMKNAFPELTDIDEVYILCRAKNSDRERRQKNNEVPFDIDTDLIIDLVKRVERHLNSIWWDPQNVVDKGKIINRPR